LTAKQSDKPEPIQEPKAVERLLRRLIDARAMVQIRHPQGEEGHLSTIIALKPYSGLYLDAPAESVISLYRPKDQLQVRSQLDGTDIRFQTQLQIHSRYEGYPALLCEWPSEIAHYERRLTFRVRMAGHRTGVTLDPDDTSQPHHGRLIDLSVGGFGALIDAGAQLNSGEMLDCMLELQGDKLYAQATVQSVAPVPGNRFSRLGARFVDLSPLQERQLGKLILELDRQTIQHSRGR
jgi:c-di-GMP-binding flagellar brake protein YcgR